jgi:hypothetical protein
VSNTVVAQVQKDTGGDVDNDDHAFVLGTRLQIDF